MWRLCDWIDLSMTFSWTGHARSESLTTKFFSSVFPLNILGHLEKTPQDQRSKGKNPKIQNSWLIRFIPWSSTLNSNSPVVGLIFTVSENSPNPPISFSLGFIDGSPFTQCRKYQGSLRNIPIEGPRSHRKIAIRLAEHFLRVHKCENLRETVLIYSLSPSKP